MGSLIFILLFGTLSRASGEVTFEGFFRVEQKNKPIGYVIQRVEQDSKTKQRKISTYIRLKDDDSEFFKYYRATATKDFRPVSYSYRANDLKIDQTSKASFLGAKINVETLNSKGRKIINEKMSIPAGTFLSAFTFYLFDLNKIPKGKELNYRAFYEERGRVHRGKLIMKDSKVVSGQKIFQTFDNVSGETIESFNFQSGEPLGARSRDGEIITYLAKNRSEAIDGFEVFPQQHVIDFFGDLPEGKKNPYFAKKASWDPYDTIQSFSSANKLARVANKKESLKIDLKVPVKSL